MDQGAILQYVVTTVSCERSFILMLCLHDWMGIVGIVRFGIAVVVIVVERR